MVYSADICKTLSSPTTDSSIGISSYYRCDWIWQLRFLVEKEKWVLNPRPSSLFQLLQFCEPLTFNFPAANHIFRGAVYLLSYNCVRAGLRSRYSDWLRADGPGIESRWWRDFPHLSRPALGSTQPPVQWVPGVKSGRGMTLTPHPLLVSWPWKGRAIPLLPLWVIWPVQSLSACTRVTFTFTFRHTYHTGHAIWHHSAETCCT